MYAEEQGVNGVVPGKSIFLDETLMVSTSIRINLVEISPNITYLKFVS